MTSTTENPPTTFDEPDYRDCFILTPGETIESIADFVERLALSQPWWLTRTSMGISGRAALERGVADALAGGALGNWHVVGRTDTTIAFAEDMRVMRYRLTYEIESPTRVSAATEVVQQTRWFGPIYWALATPLHRRFLQRLLRNAGGSGSVTTAEAVRSMVDRIER